MFIEALNEKELLPGGMKAVTIKGKEIVVCNTGNGFIAFDRRCGHMNAPLEMGTVDGHIVTCPLHLVRFDVKTGVALNDPVHLHFEGPVSEQKRRHSQYVAKLSKHIATCDIKTYETEVKKGIVAVKL
jgi:nitrite reductase/ring-hydroxylating ferredoxin subunit